jgi:hypothetical protein
MTPYWTALLAVAAFVPLATQDVPHVERLLSRRYVEGDRVQYLMKTQNDGSTYEVRITATTKKASDGRFVEEFAWSDMVANSAPARWPPQVRISGLRSRLKGVHHSKYQTCRRRLASLGQSPT